MLGNESIQKSNYHMVMISERLNVNAELPINL